MPSSDDYIVSGIGSNEARLVWGIVAGLLKPAMDIAPEPKTTDWLLAEIEKQDKQLWLVVRGRIAAAIVTDIIDIMEATGVLRVCEVPYIGGADMPRWINRAEKLIGAWAKSNGCKALVGYGRPGWQRFGYSFRGHTNNGQLIMAKDI